jgi:Leucine-rich repeat (LRR) protein
MKLTHLTAVFSLLAALPATAAAEADLTAADVAAIRHVLTVGATSPADDVALSKAADAVPVPAVRDKVKATLPEIRAAAATHARVEKIVAELKTFNGITELAPGGPAWLRDVVGDESMHLFDRLVTVDLNERRNPHDKTYKLNAAIADEWLARLDGLTDIKRLDIASADIKGPGLRHVGTLTNLESINLTLTPVTDEYLEPLGNLTKLKVLGLASAGCNGTGCKYLTKLTQLENLNFHHTTVNDEGLAEISKLTSLTRLEIVHCFFTDAGAEHLAKLKNLQRLQLGSTKATGAAVAPLKGLPNLRELDIHDLKDASVAIRNAANIATLKVLRVYVAPVKDADVAQIAGLANLEELTLSGLQLTPTGLEPLSGLKSLKKLSLGNGKVPAEAIAKLKAALPDLTVVP